MNTTNAILRAAAVALAAVAPAFAAPAPAVPLLDVRYDWSDRENLEVAKSAASCTVTLLPAEDARQNKDTIGAGIGGPLVSGAMNGWVNDGLGSLKNYGVTLRPGEEGATPADGVAVRLTLTRAYTWQVGLKIFSMVAVKAAFTDRNGVVQEKRYRAHGDKTNMWGAASEYVTTLNYGINNLLPALAKDLESLCKGQPVDAYTYAGPADAPPPKK